MKPFIEYVVKALVDFPNEVDVKEVDTERTIVYELRLNKTDIGKVIGKQGRTIQALRTLVNTGVAKNGKRAMLEIIEEKQENGQAPETANVPSTEPMPSSELKPLATDLLNPPAVS
jgi:uncharacterized protein